MAVASSPLAVAYSTQYLELSPPAVEPQPDGLASLPAKLATHGQRKLGEFSALRRLTKITQSPIARQFG
jgi:hypothetical protein